MRRAMQREFTTPQDHQELHPSQGTMTKLRQKLSWINPFSKYFEYKLRILEIQQRLEHAERAERQEERQAFLTAIQATAMVSVEASKASQNQALALNTFLNSFNVTSQPTLREWDEEADNARYIEKHVPKGVITNDKLESFENLLQKMDMGEI